MSGGVVISQLLEWLRWHFTEGEQLFAEIERDEFPHQHTEYWDCVRVYVAGGLLA